MGNGFNTIGNAPWLQNNTSSLNFSSGGFGSYGFNNGFNIWGTPASTSSSSKSTTSIEELNAKEIEKDKKIMAEAAKIQEEQAKLDEMMKMTNAQKAEINKNKKADGSSKMKSPESDEAFKKQSFFGKLFKGAMNALSGMGKVLKSIAGFNEEGKWEPLKCLRNVAIAAGATVLTVFAAPAAAALATSFGASATTAATVGAIAKGALVTVPCVAGLAGGVYKAVDGTVKACKAETQEEFDKATQDVGAGLFVAAASRTGLKKISSTAGVVSKAAEGASWGQRALASLENTFVNPFKAGYKESLSAATSMSAEATTAGLQSAKSAGFWSNLKAGRAGIKNLHADVKMSAYNEKVSKTNEYLKESIKKIDKQLAENIDPKVRHMFEYQRTKLVECQTNLNKAVTKQDWNALKDIAKQAQKETKPHAWYKFWKGNHTVDGVEYANAELKALRTKDFGRGLVNNIEGLAKMKSSTMSGIAGSSKYATEVEKYGYSTKWYAQPWNMAQNKWNQGMSKMELAGYGMTLMTPTYFLQPFVSNPVLGTVNCLAVIDNTYEDTWSTPLTKEQVDEVDKQYLAQAEAYEEQTKKNNEKLAKLYA